MTTVVNSASHNKNRQAKCVYCSTIKPSNPALAFFENRDSGSDDAKNLCLNCGYHRDAHDPAIMQTRVPNNRKTVIEKGLCPGFKPHGVYEYDLYYCGCRGWD